MLCSRHFLLAAVALFLIVPGTAQAQTSKTPGPVVTSISVQFVNRKTDVTKYPSEDEKAAMRAEIYEKAALECQAIEAAFKGKCYLKNLRVSVSNSRQFHTYSLIGLANYELKAPQ